MLTLFTTLQSWRGMLAVPLNLLTIPRVFWGSLVAQPVKNLPAMWETWVWSLGWEDPLEKEMATHSSILAWRIPWTEDLGGLQSMGSHKVGHGWSDLATAAAADCCVAIPFSRDQTQVSHIAGGFFTIWATREAPNWQYCLIYFKVV